MSGEVQTKRRNKKKKKANLEALQQQEYQEEKAITGRLLKDDQEEIEEDFELKDHSAGASGWCAKILFCILLSALLVMVGLIFMEYAGTKEVEAPSESRFAPIFEGFVDDSPVEHEETHFPDLEEEEDEGFAEDLQDFDEDSGIEEPETIAEKLEVPLSEASAEEPEVQREERAAFEEEPEVDEEKEWRPMVQIDDEAPTSGEDTPASEEELPPPLEDVKVGGSEEVEEAASSKEYKEEPTSDEGFFEEDISPSSTLKEDVQASEEEDAKASEEEEKSSEDMVKIQEEDTLASEETIQKDESAEVEAAQEPEPTSIEEPEAKSLEDAPVSEELKESSEEPTEDAKEDGGTSQEQSPSVEDMSIEELDDARFDSATYEEPSKELEESHAIFSDIISLAHKIQTSGRPDVKDLLESRRKEIDELMGLISKGSMDGVLSRLTQLREYLTELVNEKEEGCAGSAEEEHEHEELEREIREVEPEDEQEAEVSHKESAEEVVEQDEGVEEEASQEEHEPLVEIGEHDHEEEEEEQEPEIKESHEEEHVHEPLVVEAHEEVQAEAPAEEQSSTISKETEQSATPTDQHAPQYEEHQHYHEAPRHEPEPEEAPEAFETEPVVVEKEEPVVVKAEPVVVDEDEASAAESTELSEEESVEEAAEERIEQSRSPVIEHPPSTSPISSEDGKLEESTEEEETEEEEPVIPTKQELKPPPSPAKAEESEEMATSEEEEEEEEEEPPSPVPPTRASEPPKQNGPAEDSGGEEEEESEGNDADAEDDDADNFWNNRGPHAVSPDDKPIYQHADITNDDDAVIADQLDEADELLEEAKTVEELRAAKNRYEKMIDQRKPRASPRALYGQAMALDRLATEEMSNNRLEQAINTYQAVLSLDGDFKVPLKLFRKAVMRCNERARFRGWLSKGTRALQRLIFKSPDDLEARNLLAVNYLMVNQMDAAKEVLDTTLKTWPDSGFAKVHLGFILKTAHNNMEEGAKYLVDGISSKEEGTSDGRFYYHGGDALARLGRNAEADKLYKEAADLGLFLGFYQRSLYNVDRLTGRPWWTKEQTTYQKHLKRLEEKWEVIRDEFLNLLAENKKVMKDESENLREKGTWQQFELYTRGRQFGPNCSKAPKTCSLLSDFKEATGCTRGQIKFSIMQPNTHVYPHTGPTNCRIRAHLGLLIPSGVAIKVADETRTWKEGEFIIFDDSFVHEVWHNGTSLRAVLIVDFWHPELTTEEKRSLSPI